MLRRSCKGAFVGILLFAMSYSSAFAQGPLPNPTEYPVEYAAESATAGRGTYVGVFGGGGASNVNGVNQIGTALFPPSKGGPLVVSAVGRSNDRGAGLVGVQIGHELSGSQEGAWGLMPAGEFEAYYFAGTQRALLDNSNSRLPEHDFDDTFPMNNAVFVTNAVVSLRTPSPYLTPYIGGGIGAAAITINGANSPQVSPPEAGVNHFNSGTDASSWSFAAQAKTGLRVQLTARAFLFTEYRFLYVGSTTYVFGQTQYPTHAPTSPWTVRFGDMCNHFAVAGLGFTF